MAVGDITHGTVDIDATAIGAVSAVCAMDADTALAVYLDGSGYLRACVITRTGSTATVAATDYSIEATVTTCSCVIKTDTERAMAIYNSATHGWCAIVMIVSGTTVTPQTRFVIDASLGGTVTAAGSLSATSVLVVSKYTSNKAYAVVLTITSTTTITRTGSFYAVSNAYIGSLDLAMLTSSKAAVVYTDVDTLGVILDVSGTAVTVGPIETIGSGLTNGDPYGISIDKMSDTSAEVTYRDVSHNCWTMPITVVSGDEFTAGTAISLPSITAGARMDTAVHSSSSQYMASRGTGGNTLSTSMILGEGTSVGTITTITGSGVSSASTSSPFLAALDSTNAMLIWRDTTGGALAACVLTAATIPGAPAVPTELPSLSFVAYGNYQLLATLPMLTVDMVGGPKPSSIDVTLPALSVVLRTGATLRPSLPMLTAEFTGTTNFFAELDVTLPMLSANMTGTTGRLGALEVTLPGITAELLGGGTMDAELPMFTAQISSTMGIVGTITAEMPMLTVEMSATEQAYAIIEAILPMLVPSHGGRIVSVLPMLQASFSGGTTIAVTYEAYAVNLKPGESMPHQVTRYTNFPFNQIVRYQGSYYGVADDGLYLLGGDDDDGVAIPWTFETGITDFKSRNKKSVPEVFIGGRLGPTVTASVSIREETDVTYAATIVRGTGAQNHRVKIGRGLKARYWSFGLADADGSAFELDSLEPEVLELSRRL